MIYDVVCPNDKEHKIGSLESKYCPSCGTRLVGVYVLCNNCNNPVEMPDGLCPKHCNRCGSKDLATNSEDANWMRFMKNVI